MTKALQAAVLLFPGSNREKDVARAITQATGQAPSLVWHDERSLPPGTDLVVLPGGFSYGDYLRCGAIAARARIMDSVRDHAERGGLVLGICNGFQILCESGLLPGVLLRNSDQRFICKFQALRVENAATRFTSAYKKNQVIHVAIAHGEGNYFVDAETTAELNISGRIAFRYCDGFGRADQRANPNGSIEDIAGVFSKNFNILGLMPHPENLIDALTGGEDGLGLFASLADSR